ncbi:TPA: hypothetical protein N0F65_000282 [Lagenidium giganteum]|uniref:Concanavalin A-like lectin/glucanase n=1 Tax=Lagenidium giganteum TaxID=4803 RepID=A0AAV2Z8B4_9STRA|nr:TPA: hypothetical protein N0F65_000282 [Lagenidium giganteum]
MPSFAYGKGKSGKHGSVMPSDDQYLTQNKSHLSTASRARPARGWIWIFIGINLVAIVSFIFGSAMYFPPPTTVESIVEQSLKQSEALRILRRSSELEVLSSLFLWLKADAGVDLVNEAACDPLRDSTSGCEVIAYGAPLLQISLWKSHTGTGKSVIFRPGSDSKRPIFVPGNDQSGLPSIYFSCPINSSNIVALLDDTHGLVAQVGDTYVGQKFFGNAPYGQFLLHGGRPSFFTSSGLIETSEMINNGEFALLTYRLHKRQVEIKINGKGWDVNDDAVAVRMSGNSALSVGNVKDMCDTNAFQGRIAEIVVYDTVLSDVQISLVESYLRKKWWNNVMEPLAAPVPEQPVAANSQQIDDKSPEPTKPSMPSPSMNLNQVPERIIFDPDDVFEWVPDESVFRTEEQRAMASSLTARWKKEVADRITTIKNMEIGGDFLRKFIRERKEELIQLRDAMFG